MRILLKSIFIITLLFTYIVYGKGSNCSESSFDSTAGINNKFLQGSQSLKFYQDTIRLNRKEFIGRYGSNDTTKALIHYFYDKRNNKNYVYLPTIIGVSSLFYIILFPFLLPVFLLFFVAILYYGFYKLAKWIYLLFKFNRKKLLRFVQEIESGNTIDIKVWRNVLLYKKKRFKLNGTERPSKLELKQRRL